MVQRDNELLQIALRLPKSVDFRATMGTLRQVFIKLLPTKGAVEVGHAPPLLWEPRTGRCRRRPQKNSHKGDPVGVLVGSRRQLPPGSTSTWQESSAVSGSSWGGLHPLLSFTAEERSPRPQPCILYQPRSRVSRGARLSGHPADRTGRRHLLDAEIGGRKGQAYADAANGALEAWAILTTVLAQAVWFASSPLTSITEHPPLRRAISGVRPPPQSVRRLAAPHRR